MRFPKRDIDGQPLPESQRTDDRYELLAKFQGVLKSLGCDGIVVLVDRVDEPHLITGSVERMRALVWSMLDNKFLKQPGIGLKLLLPRELADYMQREDRDFYQRARLDKQNMIPSLEWTGEALYDLANARIRSCGVERPAADAPLAARRLDHRPAADRRLPRAARAAAPVQVSLPPARGPLQRPHRRQARVAKSRRKPSKPRSPSTAATRTPSTAACKPADVAVSLLRYQLALPCC